MKKNLLTSIICFLFVCRVLYCQDLSEGFTYLEKGKFQEAEIFFQNQINNGIENFTIKLCLGRAVGLNGNPQKANKMFMEMKETFPDNFELDLNLAESFLWLKKYNQAKEIYEKLLIRYPSDFGVFLGYANTLSSLKQYNEANLYIEKALDLDPENKGAKISRKYILLGLAESHKMSDFYNETLFVLEKADSLYPQDIDVTLSLFYHLIDMNRENIALERLDKYEQCKEIHPKTLEARASLAMRNRNYQLASTIIQEAKEKILNLQLGEEVYYNMLIQEVNNTLALKEYSRAKSLLDSLKSENLNSQKYNDVLANYAFATKDYQLVDSLINQSSDTLFILKLKSRKAMQKGEFRKVKKYLDRIYDIDEKNVFRHYFSKELNPNLYLSINPYFYVLSDNGGNRADERGIMIETSNRKAIRLYGSYSDRVTTQNGMDSASRKNIGVGVIYEASKFINFRTGVTKIIPSISDKVKTYNAINSSMSLNLTQQSNLTLVYNKQVYDYNTSLIQSEISEVRQGIKYYNGELREIGFYGEGAVTKISDGNNSSFLFISVFKNFLELPLLQLGYNFTFLEFENRSENYFSPDQYKVQEVFFKFDNRYMADKNVYTSFLAAFGVQSFDDNKENTQRYEAELGIKFGKRSQIGIFASYNNASSATIGGYQVKRIGLKADMRL